MNRKVGAPAFIGSISGDFGVVAATLSSATPRRLRMHGPATSTFAPVEVRAAP